MKASLAGQVGASARLNQWRYCSVLFNHSPQMILAFWLNVKYQNVVEVQYVWERDCKIFVADLRLFGLRYLHCISMMQNIARD